MTQQEQLKDCKKTLQQLVGKNVKNVDFETSEDCWRIYIHTDQGKIVLSFCKGWFCPVVEHRPLKSGKINK
ncbi:MAG: hypothetical protein KKF16_01585 [Euryarchaeota archaeon]|nr:hypothetical protein [Euryarchaeota archaeon]MBV1729851.1 hypothetical protein [Methanobacterium sp.]MBU4547227.1 hypothetical protein [Euryarchaeota archaeon]MBU4608340.1 hypothetical protein [Euryarchaeota archaeon]MBV1755643.1 hypothetical protein [Methanobacterium sp.]